MANNKKARMINHIINGVYVVSVEGSRIRTMSEAPTNPIQNDGFFTPGWLLTTKESRPFYSALKKLAKAGMV